MVERRISSPPSSLGTQHQSVALFCDKRGAVSVSAFLIAVFVYSLASATYFAFHLQLTPIQSSSRWALRAVPIPKTEREIRSGTLKDGRKPQLEIRKRKRGLNTLQFCTFLEAISTQATQYDWCYWNGCHKFSFYFFDFSRTTDFHYFSSVRRILAKTEDFRSGKRLKTRHKNLLTTVSTP